MKNKKIVTVLLGLCSGVLNGLFGAGGGVAVVPMLEQTGVPAQKAHATSVAIILPLSVVTAMLYFMNGIKVKGEMLWWLIPAGLIGAFLGAKFLKKMNNDLLRRIFGALLIYSGIRNLLS